MKMKQIYNIMNDVTKEILGETAVVEEDLSNIVDVGEQIFNATSYDHYVNSLVNRIGRTVFVNRPYRGNVPSIRKDGWEFGSAMMKIQAELPEAVENSSWELQDGQTYNQDIFKKPVVTAKIFNERVTFEVDMSITYIQIRESFNSLEQLNALLDLIYNSIDKSLTIKTNALIMRTVNYGIGATLLDDIPDANYTETSGVKAVNLLKLYNDKQGTTLTQANCLDDKDFLAFAVKTINDYQYRITNMSNSFNIDGKSRFTPKELQHLVTLATFDSSVISTLYRNSFRNDSEMQLAKHEIVPYWQGSGLNYEFSETSKINIKLASNGEPTIVASGIIGVLFDDEACMVANFERRVLTHDNKKAEFVNYFYKQDAQNVFDPSENMVVFFVA